MRLRAEWVARAAVPSSSGLPRIPANIHQTWKDANPPRKLFSPRWSRSLREHNPSWAYRLWTDADNRELVRTIYPELLRMYDGYESPIQRADVARYLIAHHHGGVYADLDTECFSPFAPLVHGSRGGGEGGRHHGDRSEAAPSLVLSYKLGRNFSRGACNSIFASAVGHPFWQTVLHVLTNRSRTPLSTGHTAVLYATGPAVLREALRRLLRLPDGLSITSEMLQTLRSSLGILVLDAVYLHPVTAERRRDDDESSRPRQAVCTHHFVSSWVEHSSKLHASVEQRRRDGDSTAAMHAKGQGVLRRNTWGEEEEAAAAAAARRSREEEQEAPEEEAPQKGGNKRHAGGRTTSAKLKTPRKKGKRKQAPR